MLSSLYANLLYLSNSSQAPILTLTLHSSLISYLLQINILLNFSAGDDCPCPEEIQEELNSFHEELRLHCGKVQHLFHLYFCPWFHLCVYYPL